MVAPPVVVLGGVHIGCYELLASEAIRSIRELKGKSVGLQGYDPEDTIRFYALRLHEAGLIKSTPNKIIAENTEWRFFNELKRELKA